MYHGGDERVPRCDFTLYVNMDGVCKPIRLIAIAADYAKTQRLYCFSTCSSSIFVCIVYREGY